jgi:hypothetical protein
MRAKKTRSNPSLAGSLTLPEIHYKPLLPTAQALFAGRLSQVGEQHERSGA